MTNDQNPPVPARGPMHYEHGPDAKPITMAELAKQANPHGLSFNELMQGLAEKPKP